ncbi:hypothetical protein DPMN_068950 [Dreissena polymorpha]|uniref:Uncharacterized protein n=1 Tax=Dreissena polymorpha TaxID=45954 RepID=A0A9D4BUM4_DREPO|nr:hypothetical protein DPMN_068950 [Dreissena polymorpha]
MLWVQSPARAQYFHINGNEATEKNCECENRSELFNRFWEGHVDAIHAVAGMSGS